MLMSYIQRMKKSSSTLVMIPRFYIIHTIGVHYYSKAYLYTYVNDYIQMYFFLHMLVVTCIFIIEIVRVWHVVTNQNLYRGEF